jgi:hypothetical protein
MTMHVSVHDIRGAHRLSNAGSASRGDMSVSRLVVAGAPTVSCIDTPVALGTRPKLLRQLNVPAVRQGRAGGQQPRGVNISRRP